LNKSFDKIFDKKLERLDGIQIGERYNTCFRLVIEIYTQSKKFKLPYVFGGAEDDEEKKELEIDYMKCLRLELHAQAKLSAAIIRFIKKTSKNFVSKILIGIKTITKMGKVVLHPISTFELIKVFERKEIDSLETFSKSIDLISNVWDKTIEK